MGTINFIKFPIRNSIKKRTINIIKYVITYIISARKVNKKKKNMKFYYYKFDIKLFFGQICIRLYHRTYIILQ